jgi:uncharacterized repeat protein (TIGR01451 family)
MAEKQPAFCTTLILEEKVMRKEKTRSILGLAGAIGMALSMLLLLFTAVPFATATTEPTPLSPTNQLTSDYVENFDTDSNWVSVDGGSLASYGTKAYTNTAFSHITFFADVALRETSGTQDGFPKTRSGDYAWRLRNASGAFWQATISEGGVGEFSVWVRRWDGSPDPNYIVEYSIDNGNNWTFIQTIDNAWLGSSDWKEVTGTINQPNGNDIDDEIIIQIRRVDGERLMIDDFSMTTFADVPSVVETNPQNGAENVPLAATIGITFNQPVTVTTNWFDLTCTSSVTLTATTNPASPAEAYTITPDSPFVYDEFCTVTVLASEVTNSSGISLTNNYSFTFATASEFGDITFIYYDLEGVVQSGESVYLAGDFTDWLTNSVQLNADAAFAVFSTTISGIAADTYEYKYVVYTDTLASGPPQWEWLNTFNHSLTVSGDATVADYRNVVIGYAALQWPPTLETAMYTSTADIYGQLYINNITNPAGEGRGLQAEVGYGSQLDPADWDWFPMSFANQVGNNDEFVGVITPTLYGVFSYTVRFDGNAGPGNPNADWTYADLSGVGPYPGGEFDISDTGVITVGFGATPIINARAGNDGDVFGVEGQVIVTPGTYSANEWVIQDESGGISAFYSPPPSLDLGDLVRIVAPRTSFAGMPQLGSPLFIEIITGFVPLEPITYTTGAVAAGDANGRLVTVEGEVSGLLDCSGAFNFDLDDGTGVVQIRIEGGTGINVCDLGVQNGSLIAVTGHNGVRFGTERVRPRTEADITLIIEGDLVATKSGPTHGFSGFELDYLINIENQTILTMENVVITDTLPLSVTYVSDSSGITPTLVAPNQYVWELGDIAPETEISFTLTISVPASITAGTTITNYLTASTDTALDDLSGLMDTAVTTFYPIVPISEARAGNNGDIFALEGRATVTNGTWGFSEWAFQDDSAGIAAFFNTDPDLTLGDTVRLIATRGMFNNQKQMVTPLYRFEIVETGPPVIPMPYTTGEIATGDTNGWLVEIEGTVSGYNGNCTGSHNFNLNDGSGAADIRIDFRAGINFCEMGIENGDTIRVVGFSTQFQSNFQVKPRFPDDITTFKPSISKEAPNTVAVGELFTYTLTVQNQLGYTLTNVVISDVVPVNSTFAYALNGGMLMGDTVIWQTGDLADQSSLQVSFAVTATGPSGAIIGNELYAVRGDNLITPTFGSPVYTFVGDFMPIYQIQGEGFFSPYQGVTLPTQGVVVGFFEGNSSLGNFNAFFIQDPDAGGAGTDASDGIMVNPGLVNAGVAVGDLVRVTGEVQEYSEWDGANCSAFSTDCVTQINTGGTANIEILDAGYTITPTVVNPPLGDAATAELYWESLEGMLVTMPITGIVVGPTSFSTIDVIRSDYGIDRVFRNTPYQGTPFGVRHFTRFGNMPGGAPNLIAGSVITNVTGPLGYSYGRYIAFTQFDNQWQVVSEAQPPAVEPTWPTATMDEFTIMSFNVENFNSASGSHMAKVVRSIDNMNGPTFIGIQEIRVSTVITNLLTELSSLGYDYDYAYSHPDVGGHGVAVLWRTNRVTDVEWSTEFQGCSPYGSSSSTYDPLWDACRDLGEYPLFSRRPVVVTGTVQFDDGDMTVVVIGNHFKSKLGGIPADLRRLGQAELVAGLADSFAANTTPYVIVVGDLNDFEDSPPLMELYASGTLTNTWYTLPPDQRYSYIFRGVSQILDHILVTDELLAVMADVSGIHNSADFPFNPYKTDASVVWRVSDHDQKMATFSFPNVADLSLGKVVELTNDPALPGDVVTYTVTLTNAGITGAFAVAVTDTLPAELEGMDLNMMVDVPANESVMLVYTATVAANTYGATVTNTAYFDHSSGSGADSASFMVVGPPDLTISKAVTLGNDPALPGDVVTYTISLSNNGAATAFNVMLTDTLPSEITFGDFIMGTNIDPVYADGVITWSGDLPADVQNAVIVYTATVAANTYSTTVTNTVHFDHASGSGSDSTSFMVVGPPDLTISKAVTLGNDPTLPGDVVTYTISLSNDGAATAFNVMLTDTLPSEITFGDFIMGTNIDPVYADGVITWTGDLPAGVQNAVIVFTATVNLDVVDNSEVVNTVHFTYDEGSGLDSATFTVTAEEEDEVFTLYLPLILKP